MAFLGSAFGTEGFDASTVDPSAPRSEALPAGKYVMQIIDSEMKPTNSGGAKLALTMEVIDGEFQGRRAWDNLNLVNASTVAVEIAQKTFSAICHATGKMHVTDSEQLHFCPMLVSISMIPEGTIEKSGYVHKRDKNEVAGYSKAEDQIAPRASSPAPRPTQPPAPTQRQAPAQAAPAPKGAPPWKRPTA